MLVLDFNQISKNDVNIAGGKGANLGEMTKCGITVPGGFVVTAEAYRLFIEENNLKADFSAKLEQAQNDEAKLLAAAEHFRAAIKNAALPPALEKEIREKFAALGAERVAVRSSATAEDLPDASFAGQQETYLNVRGIDEVLAQIKECYASLWGNRAVCYRQNQGYDQLSVALAVVVQQMVESEKAGVLFTANPVSGSKDEIQINASWGLGESVVSGKVTADSFVCSKNGKVKSSVCGSKKTQIVYADDGTKNGTKEISVEEAAQKKLCLSEAEIAELCAEGVKIEKHYGFPMDIEWAIKGGKVYILQARAITTLGTETENAEEQALIQKYIEGTKVKGPQKKNMAFQLEKMPYAYRPLDYDFIMQINHQKAVIFSENGLELSSDPQFDDDGIMTLPKSSVKINGKIFKIFKTLKNIKNFDWCEKHCREQMPKHEAEIARIKKLDFSTMTIAECGDFIKHAFQLTADISYDRFMYAVFPGVVGGGLSKVIKKINPKYTTYDFYWSLDNKTSVVTKDVAKLAENLGKIDGVKDAICSGKKYDDICKLFPETVPLFNAFLEKNGYKSDFNCYCIIAHTLIEEPDRLLNILRPLLANEDAAVSENTKDFGALMEQIKAIYGSDFLALEKKINQYRYFHVVREETQYLWETLFCFVRRCLERANELLLGNSDYEHGIANLSYKELIATCAHGTLSESDQEKISRRNSKHPLAEKVWSASKLLVFDSNGETLKGISGSTGVAVGPARIIRSPAEFYKMQKGDVLVCELTDPEWTPLFKLASAVVADTGSELSHAAIVAREFGLPAVLGTGFATQRFSDGQTIRVDGDKGEACAV